MAQTSTVMPTGIRAFNTVVVAGAAETEVLFVKGGDGQQLSLESIDGSSTATAVLRIYSVSQGFATPAQIGQTNLPVGSFNTTFVGMVTAPDEVIPQRLPFKAAVANGVLGNGGLRITVQYVGGGTLSIGANVDRRLDGPFER
jgi:hypothetical protein